jgi:hypothetical protein
MAGKYAKAKRGAKGGGKKGGGYKRAKIPRNAMSNYGGTVFPLTRTGTINSDGNGVIDSVFAVGNINIKGPGHDSWNATANIAQVIAGPPFGLMLDNLRALYSNMRVISHEIQLLPVCAGVDVATTPLEVVYVRYGVDTGGNVTNATKLIGYGANGSSTILTPSDNKMPSHSRTFTPPAGSMNARETYPIPTSGSAQDVDVVNGNQYQGRTFGFLKLYASDLKPSASTADGVVTYYRYIERIQVMCKDRRSVA